MEPAFGYGAPMRQFLWAGLVCAALVAGCTDAEEDVAPQGGAAGADAGGDASADTASDSAVDVGSDAAPGNAPYRAQGSVAQVFVTHATPGTSLELRDGSDATVAIGTADHLGSFVFRKLAPGAGYRVHTVGVTPAERSDAVTVLDPDHSVPDAAFYEGQKLEAGNLYLTMRDGTTLAAFVTLPGPASAGPYPTIVNYSGYDPGRPGHAALSGAQTSLCTTFPVLCDAPSDGTALIAALNGYATVSVNMRGTGCSGGAYDYFERLQVLDGYDIVEIVAAQPWVHAHKVGMTGISYPGISQLFVAHGRPPSLAAIAPLSVIGNTATTLEPGGILNNGFAMEWIANVYDKAAPYGQGWEQARVDAGDTVCEENQLLHDQRFDNIAQARGLKYYDPVIADPVNPTLFVHDIDVPVFLACAFQDEQTGPFFTTLLDQFTGAPSKRLTVYNGVHVDSLAPALLVEWKTFLDLYVADRVPGLDPNVRALGAILTQQIFGVAITLPPDRLAGSADVAAARAAWEAEPPVRVLFENGAGGAKPGAPVATFERSYAKWPIPGVAASRWYFQPDGSLGAAAPTTGSAASSFHVDPTAGDRGVLAPGAGAWDLLPNYDWRVPAEGDAVAWTTAPLAADLLMVGTGSVDVWLQSDADDADLEVNLSEVRPDGQEMYVQSGWLRATRRKLDASSTDLWPEPTYLEKDSQPLVAGQWAQVRIPIAGFAHAFRKDSRIRIAIDTPGDSRDAWRFELLPQTASTAHRIAHSSAMPSSVALPVLPGADVPTELPACPSLRAQPCRTFVDHPNVAAP